MKFTKKSISVILVIFMLFTVPAFSYSTRSLVSTDVSAVNNIPSRVTGLTGKAYTNSVKLSWNKSTNATCYYVYKYNVSKNSYTRVASPSTNSCTVSNLLKNTTYKFCVQAIKKTSYNSYASSMSSMITLKTANSLTPSKVTGVKASSVTSNSVKISWSRSSGSTGYYVFKYINNTQKYISLGKTSSLSKTITGLKSNTTYKFAVQAYYTKSGKTYWATKSSLITVKTKGGSSDPSTDVKSGSYAFITQPLCGFPFDSQFDDVSGYASFGQFKKGDRVYVNSISSRVAFVSATINGTKYAAKVNIRYLAPSFSSLYGSQYIAPTKYVGGSVANAGGYYICTDGDVYIQKGPDFSYGVVATASGTEGYGHMECFELIGTNSDASWYFIESLTNKNHVGWVYADYVDYSD